jgi:hypothetical protein
VTAGSEAGKLVERPEVPSNAPQSPLAANREIPSAAAYSSTGAKIPYEPSLVALQAAEHGPDQEFHTPTSGSPQLIETTSTA